MLAISHYLILPGLGRGSSFGWASAHKQLYPTQNKRGARNGRSDTHGTGTVTPFFSLSILSLPMGIEIFLLLVHFHKYLSCLRGSSAT